MKCPFCSREKLYGEEVCAHCKFPFEKPYRLRYRDSSNLDNMLSVAGDSDVLAKLYGDTPEIRVVDFNNKISWFRRMMKGKPWD